jgi:predicted ABC-type ATPase
VLVLRGLIDGVHVLWSVTAHVAHFANLSQVIEHSSSRRCPRWSERRRQDHIGAGTLARRIGVDEYVNADLIAAGLSPRWTVATQLARMREIGYETRLIYLWLSSADVAVARVQQRVDLGGHSIPKDVIRRRYAASVRNLRMLYLPLVGKWRVYYNSDEDYRVRPVASGQGQAVKTIVRGPIWRRITEDGV